MNIDDLKDAWKDENIHQEVNTQPIVVGNNNSPVARVRRNMRNEFIGIVFAYVTLFGFLAVSHQPPLYYNLFFITMCVFILINGYYVARFFVFYRSMSRFDLNMKESIAKVAFDLQLNMELYRGYNICVTPMTFIIFLEAIGGSWFTDFLIKGLQSPEQGWQFFWLLGTLLCSFVVSYFITEWHLSKKYGKPLRELKLLWEQLNAADTV